MEPEDAARRGWQLGEWAAAVLASLAVFVGGRKTGRAAVVDDILDTFRKEAEETRCVMREEAESTRRAISESVGSLHRRIDSVAMDVARIDGRTESRRSP